MALFAVVSPRLLDAVYESLVSVVRVVVGASKSDATGCRLVWDSACLRVVLITHVTMPLISTDQLTDMPV